MAACGGVAVASRLRNGGCAVAFPARRTQTTARRMPSLRCSASNAANRVLRMRIMNVLRIRFRVLRIRIRVAATQITCRLQVMWQQKGALALPAVWVSLAMGAMAFLVASFFCWRLTFCRRLVRYGRHGRRSQGTSAFVHVVSVSLRGCACGCACARPCAPAWRQVPGVTTHCSQPRRRMLRPVRARRAALRRTSSTVRCSTRSARRSSGPTTHPGVRRGYAAAARTHARVRTCSPLGPIPTSAVQREAGGFGAAHGGGGGRFSGRGAAGLLHMPRRVPAGRSGNSAALWQHATDTAQHSTPHSTAHRMQRTARSVQRSICDREAHNIRQPRWIPADPSRFRSHLPHTGRALGRADGCSLPYVYLGG